jgi:hypothetical protein
MIHEGAQILSENLEAQFGLAAERLGGAMTARIEGDESEAGGRFKEAERLGDIGAEPVLKEKREARSLVAIMKLNPVVREQRHAATLPDPPKSSNNPAVPPQGVSPEWRLDKSQDFRGLAFQ